MDSENNASDSSISPNQNSFELELHNPMLTKFNEFSHFIYDIDEYKNYFNKVKDKNRIKLAKKEEQFLENFVCKINYEEALSKGQVFLTINKHMADDLLNLYRKPKILNELDEFLLKEYADQNNRVNFTCRKLSTKYKLLTNRLVSKSTIYNILKKRLGLSWIKKTIKTNKINGPKNVLMMMTFIKIIIRCFIQKFSVIYVDESSIQTYNNHLKIWSNEKENFTAALAPKKRFNLIMGVNEKGVLFFKINKENTNNKIFLEFMEGLYKKIKENKIDRYAIVLDNLSCHKVKELYDFYIKNKINIIFNSPYISSFNSIEYAFRDLKKILYTKIYSTENELITDVENIISSDSFQKKIYYNLKITCQNYLSFHAEMKCKNLNSFDAK